MKNISKEDRSIATGLALLSVAICAVVPWLLSLADTDEGKAGYHWILWEIPIFAYMFFALYWGSRDKRLYKIILPIMTALIFMCLLPYYGFSWLNLAVTAILSATTVAVMYLLFKETGSINEEWRVRDASYRAEGIPVTYPKRKYVVLVCALAFIAVIMQVRAVPGPVETWYEILYFLPITLYGICATLRCKSHPILFYGIGTIALWGCEVLTLYPQIGFSETGMILAAIIAVLMAVVVAVADLLYRWGRRGLKVQR